MLPNSPVRKVHECKECGNINVQFLDPSLNRSYSKEEWSKKIAEGLQALRKILAPIHQDDPKFFSD
ncbi:MAG TPA: hypothetical protein DEG69_02200 [Flavobacteriaceae bacterium]|nr:hypothetical protein [Flavobacteriaceae bacterium]